MTQFSQIELIYNRLLNLINEIESSIKEEEYDAAFGKLNLHDKLIRQLFTAKKTAALNADEISKMQTMETTIKEKNDAILADLKRLRAETASQVDTTKKKVKLSSAYEHQSDERQGDLIDISE